VALTQAHTTSSEATPSTPTGGLPSILARTQHFATLKVHAKRSAAPCASRKWATSNRVPVTRSRRWNSTTILRRSAAPTRRATMSMRGYGQRKHRRGCTTSLEQRVRSRVRGKTLAADSPEKFVSLGVVVRPGSLLDQPRERYPFAARSRGWCSCSPAGPRWRVTKGPSRPAHMTPAPHRGIP